MQADNTSGTALVTGGASGMGLAIVERLARDGFRVVMAAATPTWPPAKPRHCKRKALPSTTAWWT